MPHQDISKISFQKEINPDFTYRLFKWYELGILGVGKSSSPTVDMTRWVDTESDQAKEVEAEIIEILKSPKVSHQAYNSAYVPEDINKKKWLTYYIWKAEEYIPADVRMSLKTQQEITNWIYSQNLAIPNWTKMTFISRPPPASRDPKTGFVNFIDMQKNGEWMEDAPLCKKWIESWNLFDDIGRIVVFDNSPGNAVGIHRDIGFKPNSAHHVSIQFTKNRPAFMYDEMTKEKIYHNTPAYFFNISDNHGVDAETESKFTVRVDGIFKSKICEILGLDQGYVWAPQYPSGHKLKNIQIYEPDERP